MSVETPPIPRCVAKFDSPLWRRANNTRNTPGTARFKMHMTGASMMMSHVYVDGILIRYGAVWPRRSKDDVTLLSGLQEICTEAGNQMTVHGDCTDAVKAAWTIADRLMKLRCAGIVYCSADVFWEMREHGIYTITPDIPTLIGGDLIINEFDLTKFNLGSQLDSEVGRELRSRLEARGIKF